ncbi:MAG: Na+/H+ antiporter NhaC family protein [Acidobacteriota bacterium]
MSASLRDNSDTPLGSLRLGDPRAKSAGVFAFLTLLFLPTVAFAAEDTARTLGWWTLLPPILAIGVALLLREVLPALLIGIFGGTLLLSGGNPLAAFGRLVDNFLLGALADADHAAILIFSALLGAMVAVIGKSGGSYGIVDWLRPIATSPRRGQVATWLMGVAIFFDDYANTLIVGSTMRPITDKLRISREKLAYIVDTTAAPIVSLIPISTWVGFELGLLQDAFDGLALERNAFTTVVDSIPYRSYQILALLLGFLVAVTGRDLAAMLKAEKRARTTGDVLESDQKALADFSSNELQPVEGKPRRALNAILPIVTVVFVTMLGLYSTGSAGLERAPELSTLGWWREILANANSYTALLWASSSGLLVAIVAPALQRILSIKQGIDAAVEGCKATLVAFLVLLLAWALGDVCKALGTAEYLVGVTEGQVGAEWMPALTFLLAAAVSFATGTAWGTMGILSPLAIPLAHSLSTADGLAASGYESVLLGTVAAVLAGSVWGDHCSPISDTTILSSMASGCDHLAHVKTQLPYALLTGLVALLLGFVATGHGLSPFLGLALGALLVAAILRLAGHPSSPEA